jgi:lipopolysaccharide export system permease protein
MLNILDRYIFREISLTWFAVTTVLLVIMVANVLTRILARVTAGTVPADALLLLVGLKVINLLVTLIPLGLYLGVLLAFGRLYRDSEMAAVSACGTGVRSLYRPVILNGLIGVVLIAFLTFWASPWAARFEREINERVASQSVASLLSAGNFVEILNGDAVVFTESLSENKQQFQRVFVHRDLEDGAFEVETAKSAFYQRVESPDPDGAAKEYIVFVDGVSLVGKAGGDEYRRTRFSRHGVLLPSDPLEDRALENSAKTLRQLWNAEDSQSRAEIQWRVSIPLAAMMLAILAVPLSHASPREGRYSKIVLAILIYIPYANLLVLARKWLSAGVVPPWLGLWWVHALFFCVVIYFTVRRFGFNWVRARLTGSPV